MVPSIVMQYQLFNLSRQLKSLTLILLINITYSFADS